MPKIRSGNVSSQTKGYISNANSAMGQQRTNRMHQRQKAAMATSLGSFQQSQNDCKVLRSPTTTTEKPEKFRSLYTGSGEAVLPPRTESPHPAACENHRSPSEGRDPMHESKPECVLRPTASEWKA